MTVPQVQITARNHYLTLPDPLPLNGAIAIPCVLFRESKLRPGSQGDQRTEHGGILNRVGAYGAASWNGPKDPSKVGDPRYDRQAALLAFSTQRSLAVADLTTQLDFILHEMANGYPLSWAAVRSGASFETIIRTIVEDYERPLAPEPEIADAIRIATALAAVPLPAPGAPRPLPSVPAPKLPPTVPGLPPITADAAGRITAVADFIHRAREARVAQLIAADPEVVAYDAMLDGLGHVHPAQSLPSPPADPATTQGTQMLDLLTKNWKTSLSGIITAASHGIALKYPDLAPVMDWITTGGLAAMGLTAKDGNVTGGTVQQ